MSATVRRHIGANLGGSRVRERIGAWLLIAAALFMFASAVTPWILVGDYNVGCGNCNPTPDLLISFASPSAGPLSWSTDRPPVWISIVIAVVLLAVGIASDRIRSRRILGYGLMSLAVISVVLVEVGAPALWPWSNVQFATDDGFGAAGGFSSSAGFGWFLDVASLLLIVVTVGLQVRRRTEVAGDTA